MSSTSPKAAPAAQVFVVSAPSGTGKTTLNRRLVTEHTTRIELSISYTARPQRQGETNGVDYHFVTPDEFRQKIADGRMLEHAEVFGKLYGTSIAEVNRIAGLGKTVLLEIDVQGWRQAHVKLPEATSIFILPPSIKELWSRLEARGTDALEVRLRRLRTARQEIAAGDLYDRFVENADFEAAYRDLQDIIINGKTGRLSASSGRSRCQELLSEFDSEEWIQKLFHEKTDKI